MLTYSSYGARNRHLGGPTTDAGETPSPLEKLLLKQEKTPSDHKLRGRTCWNLHLLHGNRTNSRPGFPSGHRIGVPAPCRDAPEELRRARITPSGRRPDLSGESPSGRFSRLRERGSRVPRR